MLLFVILALLVLFTALGFLLLREVSTGRR